MNNELETIFKSSKLADNKILGAVLSSYKTEDKIMKIIVKEFTDFTIDMINKKEGKRTI